MPGLPEPLNIFYEITSLFKLTKIGFCCFQLRIQSNKYAWVKSQTLKILAERLQANYWTSFSFSSFIYKMKTIQCNRSWACWERSLWFSLRPSSFDISVCSYGIIIILRTQEMGFHFSLVAFHFFPKEKPPSWASSQFIQLQSIHPTPGLLERRQNSESDRPGCQSWLCHLPAIRLQGTHSAFPVPELWMPWLQNEIFHALGHITTLQTTNSPYYRCYCLPMVSQIVKGSFIPSAPLI